MVGSMTFRVFGPLQVRTDDDHIIVGGRRERALLASLLLTPGEPMSVAELSDALWPDTRPRDVPHALRTHVMRLRRTIGKDVIVTTPSAYSAAVPAISVDAHRFESDVRDASARLWEHDLAGAAASFTNALATWSHGEPWIDLAGTPRGDAVRARLTEQRLETEERLAAIHVSQHRSPVDMVEKLALEAPLREHRWLLLMHTLFCDGQQARALRCCSLLRGHLRTEAGLDPDPRIQALEHRILEQDPTLYDDDPLSLVLS